MRRALSLLFAVVLVAAFPSLASAQSCAPEWLPGKQGGLLLGTAYTSATFDPDGAGPLPPLLVVGGQNIGVAGIPRGKLIAYDGTLWRTLDTDTVGSVDVLHLHNGQLYAAGGFSSIGGVSANGIARWNGTSWSPLAGGVHSIRTMATLGSDLFVGGSFFVVNGITLNNIAKWNGSSWSAVAGGGVTGSGAAVNALHSSDGILYVGGTFTNAGPLAVTNLATHTGTQWRSIGAADGEVRGITSYIFLATTSRRIVISGSFNNVDGIAAPDFARYNPIADTWAALPPAPILTSGGKVFARSNGLNAVELFAGIVTPGIPPFSSGSVAQYRLPNGAAAWEATNVTGANAYTIYDGRVTIANGKLLSWDGAGWAPPFTGAVGYPNSLAQWDGSLFAGTTRFDGSFAAPATLDRFNEATGGWSEFARFSWTGFPGPTQLFAVQPMPDGALLVGGAFNRVNADSINALARWDGSVWHQLGGGFTANDAVLSVAPISATEFVAGGQFTQVGGVPANNIARFQGGAWQPIGPGVNAIVRVVRRLNNGDLVAGGDFTGGIARFNGFTWSPLGGGTAGRVSCIVQLADGTLVASGAFSQMGSTPARRIARWNGATWSAMGVGLGDAGSSDDVTELLPIAGGRLLAAGQFSTLGDGTPAPGIAMWNGTTWSAVDGGLQSSDSATPPTVLSLATTPTGRIAAGGLFDRAGPHVSVLFALAQFGSLADVAGPGQTPGGDGQLTADDIIVFIGFFFSQDARADVAGPGQSVGPDGQFTADDIIVFIGAFFTGC